MREFGRILRHYILKALQASGVPVNSITYSDLELAFGDLERAFDIIDKRLAELEKEIREIRAELEEEQS